MNWFVFRQHRKQYIFLGLFLALYAAFAIPSGLHFWHAYQHTLAGCHQNPANPICSDLNAGSLFQTIPDHLLFGLIPTAVLFLPIVLGAFWGAPLIAREHEGGTNQLVWTQSVSRRRWLTAKLVGMLLATAVFMAAFAAILTWWSKTTNTLDMDRFSNGNEFGIQGIVPVAIGLFVVSCGILFGAWFRKTMVAVGVTLAVFAVVAHIVIPNLVRPNYMKPVAISMPIGPRQLNDNSKIPQNAWIVSQLIYNGQGKAIYGDIYPFMPQECQKLTQDIQVPDGSHVAKVKAAGNDPVDDCLNHHGWHSVAKYQPGYRYWDFQRIETGIYLGMTALVIGATYWLVLKRDA